MDKLTIPVITCFDNNYCAPASVCFYSLLKNSNSKYNYKFYILQSDITNENKEKLNLTIKDFSNSSVEFIDMNNKFEDLFNCIKIKSFYSKEMFYKFCLPNLFPQYKKVILTDVDVVFLGDVSKEFFETNLDNDYIGAYKCPILKDGLSYNYFKLYEKDFTLEEQKAIQYSGGYYIYNLEKMRNDNLETKFIEYALNNTQKIIQPEQDCINITCYPKIKQLKPNALICTYFYDTYKTEDDFNNDLNYTAQELKFALKNPIQLHYATHIKPWNNINCLKNEIFFAYLSNTPFFNDVLKTLLKREIENIKPKEYKIKLFGAIPILKIRKNSCYLFNFIKIGKLEERK